MKIPAFVIDLPFGTIVDVCGSRLIHIGNGRFEPYGHLPLLLEFLSKSDEGHLKTFKFDEAESRVFESVIRHILVLDDEQTKYGAFEKA